MQCYFAYNARSGTARLGRATKLEGVALPPTYLTPYLRAAARHGPAFASLLWASPHTQAARFGAFTRLCDLNGRSILDAGCGRADLLDFLLARNIHPTEYIGLEAVPELASAAAQKAARAAGEEAACAFAITIIQTDFIAEPKRLFAATDILIFSGSLNTLDEQDFHHTLHFAYDAAVRTLTFNFLASPALAAADYLHWHRPADVLAFARTLGGTVQMLDDYLDGDCTIVIHKEPRNP